MPITAAVIAMLAIAGGAQAATSSTLKTSTARTLAQKLVDQQKRERSLIFAELGKAHRRSATRIDFGYRDRSTDNALCLAQIVVVQTQSGGKTHRAADIRNAKCHGIPGFILDVEDLTRALRNDVKAAKPTVLESLDRYDKSLPTCDRVVVPQDRRDEANLLVRAAGVAAFYRPLRVRLGEFDDDLHALETTDPNIERSQNAWERVIVLVDELPPAADHPCRALRTWSDNGFSDDTAPADFGELAVVIQQFKVQYGVLKSVAGYLDDQGVVPRVARAFTPLGLLALVDPDRKL